MTRTPHKFQPGGPAGLCRACRRVEFHEVHLAAEPLELDERVEMFAMNFTDQANSIAYQWGGPLYVVGSMLTSTQPGDLDLRLAIAREDLIALFGKGADEQGSEWSRGRHWKNREELKQSRRLTRRWRRAWAPRVDFQFCISLFYDDGGPIWGERPRRRLDTVPLEHFNAGRGEP